MPNLGPTELIIVLVLVIIALVFAAGLVWSLLALNALRKRAPRTPRDA